MFLGICSIMEMYNVSTYVCVYVNMHGNQIYMYMSSHCFNFGNYDCHSCQLVVTDMRKWVSVNF